jgi:hypothetical protein
MSAGASLRPSDAATGGFLDATNATITNARFVDSYPGGKASLLLEVTYQPEGENAKARTELYRGGSIEQARPTANGGYYTPEAFRMRKDTGAMKFIVSLVEGGFDENKLGDDIRVIIGTKVFLRRKAIPKFTTQDGTVVADKDILLVEKVLAMPSEKKVAAKAAVATKSVAAKPAPKAVEAVVAPVVADGGDAEAELVAIVSTLLNAAENNTIQRNRIGSAVFNVVVKATPPHPNRAPIMALVNKGDAFFVNDARPWVADKETIVGYPSEEAA